MKRENLINGHAQTGTRVTPRLARSSNRVMPPQNAAEKLRQLIHDDPEFGGLTVSAVGDLTDIADLLDAYRFILGRLLKSNPDYVLLFDIWAPERMAIVQEDIDG
jgi:hypothetical protein